MPSNWRRIARAPKLAQPLGLGLLTALLVALAVLRPTPAFGSSRFFATPRAAVAGPALAQPAPLAPSAVPLAALSPSAVEDHVFTSASVGRDLHYLIYLPPGYTSNPTQRFPVLYMLHGRGGVYTEWAAYGLLDSATRLIEAEAIQPFIIVMPQGEQAYWVDHADNGPRWGTYVARDLVAEVDGRFRTLAERQSRAVGGVSMGGCGALQLAMNFNDVFGIVGAHSPAFRTHDTAPDYFGDQAWFDAHSPVPLFKTYPDRARRLKLRIDMGAQDTWSPAAEAFHRQLAAQGIPHTWLSRPGGHSGDYWTSHVDEYLRYYSSAFQG